MDLIRRSPESYAELLHKLQPLGVLWPDRREGTLAAVYEALGQQLSQIDGRVVDLFVELDPTRSFELLADWESDLGLPESCRTLAGPVSERRAVVLAKLRAEEAYNSRDWLVSLAAELGFTVTLTEFDPQPFVAGSSAAGDPVEGGWHRQMFRVNAPLETLRFFRAGTGRAGDPLVDFGNDLLECVIRAAKPAHVQVIFAYA